MTSQFGRARYANTITGRTGQSGGSVGGDKKPGFVNYGVTWSRGNMGNFLQRAPHGCCNQSVAFALYNTTKHPTQVTGYRATHSGLLG
jgi:hypothetical protein